MKNKVTRKVGYQFDDDDKQKREHSLSSLNFFLPFPLTDTVSDCCPSGESPTVQVIDVVVDDVTTQATPPIITLFSEDVKLKSVPAK